MNNQINDRHQEKAILVGVIHGHLDEKTLNDHLDEMELLAETAGVKVVGRVVQRLARINAKYFIGRGKAEEIIQQSTELKIDLIIFDDDLTPAQTKNFQKLSDSLKIIDRSALILDIFRKHAKTREAKTQVELAHLQYLLPRLTRMWTHLERQMGGVGTRSGAGETQIEVDRRLIRDRISKLKKELVRIDKDRLVQGKKRKDSFRVALVGYTNAGKSTLMKALTGSDVFIQDQLFATLDTTLRSLKLDEHHEIIISDTVGFIRKLPHHLIASFRSTLNEVVEADLICIVLDASNILIRDHLRTIKSVLKDLNASENKYLYVLNKIDLVDEESTLKWLNGDFPEGIMVSAKNHLRLGKLQDKIRSIMDENYKTVQIDLSYDQGKSMSIAQKGVEVLERKYHNDGIQLTIRGNAKRINQILSSINLT